MDDEIRVVVAQGYCLLRSALVERLEREPGIEVCAVIPSVEEVSPLIPKHHPHVILANVSPKCSAGMVSLKKIKRSFRGVGILALSCDSEFENFYVGLSFRAGADGYVSSADTLENLIEAIRTVGAGQQYISPQAKTVSKEKPLGYLSEREAEVFCLIGCGHVPRRIAAGMNLSVRTVESYLERIRKKMKMSSGADLLYSSTSFMRSMARGGITRPRDRRVKALLSTTK